MLTKIWGISFNTTRWNGIAVKKGYKNAVIHSIHAGYGSYTAPEELAVHTGDPAVGVVNVIYRELEPANQYFHYKSLRALLARAQIATDLCGALLVRLRCYSLFSVLRAAKNNLHSYCEMPNLNFLCPLMVFIARVRGTARHGLDFLNIIVVFLDLVEIETMSTCGRMTLLIGWLNKKYIS